MPINDRLNENGDDDAVEKLARGSIPDYQIGAVSMVT